MPDAVIILIERKIIVVLNHVVLNIFVFVRPTKLVNYLKFVFLITAIITTGRGKVGKNQRVDGLWPREFVINCIFDAIETTLSI